MSSRLGRVGGLVLALLLLPASASAQDPVPFGADLAIEVHTLQIQDGRLHLDGEVLPNDAIPADLDLDGLSLEVQYSGPVAPLLTLGGVAYVFDGHRLVRFEEGQVPRRSREADAVQVYGLGQPTTARSEELRRSAPAEALSVPAGSRSAGPASVGRAASESAYLMHLSEQDRRLYDLLQQERVMEAEAHGLAQRIHRLPASPERSAHVEDLRALLSEAFALKQAVRLAEVERAEAQLDAVRERLDERATRRDAIIEERLRSLVGDL
ncbi:MAG: hypothetical protein AAGG50_13935 [Bacteroidota bacterium]